MQYRDFSQNRYKAKWYRNGKRGNGFFSRWVKPLVMVVSTGVLIFGLKIFLSPVVGVMADILSESGTAVTYMLNKDSIRQDGQVTNILLIGIDRRATLSSGTLTDTLMIVSYHHDTQEVTLLSLPRDLWIDEQKSKINALYSLGGIDLLESTIQAKLGIPVHYYVLVGFEGFEKAIDAVGGVDVYVERGFDDYMYPRPGYENAPWAERWQHVSFDAGWQTMDGKTALAYARSRHALGPEGSDFARARRQQKVVSALGEKILSSETLFNLDKLRSLYLILEDYVKTDVTLSQLPLFYQMAKKVDRGSVNLKTYVLEAGNEGPGSLLYSPDPKKYGGAYVLLPKTGWEEIQKFVHTVIYGKESKTVLTSPTWHP